MTGKTNAERRWRRGRSSVIRIEVAVERNGRGVEDAEEYISTAAALMIYCLTNRPSIYSFINGHFVIYSKKISTCGVNVVPPSLNTLSDFCESIVTMFIVR